ncbi:hypothetical protein NE237_022025 [Protea cynaroides]|uniref:Uncharacterized protein n=1 Tax=Protea cynaroides TaxID=273540 RepID=A0A9Q0HA80_9MAGN|nr:hypothetical protein NE237_022025 [Protea cynaroides]
MTHFSKSNSSQQEHLRHRRFCRELGVVDPKFSSSRESTRGKGILTNSTKIMMCSLLENPSCQLKEFLMLQENLPMSSQEQTMNLVGIGVDHRTESGIGLSVW